LLVLDYSKLGANKLNNIRKDFKKSEISVKVVKNSTVEFIFKKLGYDNCNVDKMNAFVFGDDPVVLAKKVVEVQKKEGALGVFDIRYAVIDRKRATKEQVKVLSTLPNRNDLTAALLSTMNAPLTSFVMLINELNTKFVRLLDVYKNSKSS
ncbi:MAG: 50S ribosomal protein L10, partial [Planctomycetes bacterium]|nr:50S ribosomal protein L10 [Planctomycetota bacterium]